MKINDHDDDVRIGLLSVPVPCDPLWTRVVGHERSYEVVLQGSLARVPVRGTAIVFLRYLSVVPGRVSDSMLLNGTSPLLCSDMHLI